MQGERRSMRICVYLDHATTVLFSSKLYSHGTGTWNISGRSNRRSRKITLRSTFLKGNKHTLLTWTAVKKIIFWCSSKNYRYWVGTRYGYLSVNTKTWIRIQICSEKIEEIWIYTKMHAFILYVNKTYRWLRKKFCGPSTRGTKPGPYPATRVADLWIFGTDLNPRIHTGTCDKWIRVRIRILLFSSVTFRTLTKKLFFAKFLLLSKGTFT